MSSTPGLAEFNVLSFSDFQTHFRLVGLKIVTQIKHLHGWTGKQSYYLFALPEERKVAIICTEQDPLTFTDFDATLKTFHLTGS